jgi:hypothetical protein
VIGIKNLPVCSVESEDFVYIKYNDEPDITKVFVTRKDNDLVFNFDAPGNYVPESMFIGLLRGKSVIHLRYVSGCGSLDMDFSLEGSVAALNSASGKTGNHSDVITLKRAN